MRIKAFINGKKAGLIVFPREEQDNDLAQYVAQLEWDHSHRVHFTITEPNGLEREQVAYGDVKWDGCVNWTCGDCMFHACEAEHMDLLHATIRYTYLLARHMMSAQFPDSEIDVADQALLLAVLTEPPKGPFPWEDKE